MSVTDIVTQLLWPETKQADDLDGAQPAAGLASVLRVATAIRVAHDARARAPFQGSRSLVDY